jgi:Fic family protein
MNLRREQGSYLTCTVAGESYRAYLPTPLPPEPPLEFDSLLLGQIEKANRALGRLDGMMSLLPNINLFLYQYIRKEAVLSSQIEGTQSSLSDLLLYEMEEMPGVPLGDVEEVSNYVAAMNHGIKRLKDGFPMSLRLLREIHAVLLSGVRGSNKQPGEFRRSQNWLGGTRPGNAAYVPPPPERLMESLGPLELFLNEEEPELPVLIRTALVHVQFETIHPYLDGNGRLGRLLISLMLWSEGTLAEPLLYLSLYFKLNRLEYYERLQRVRTHGDWEGWLAYFLRGVHETSRQVYISARSSLELFENDRQKILTLGRLAVTGLRLHEHLQAQPLTTIAQATEKTAINRTSISRCLASLADLGIVSELTGKHRYRTYAYTQYISMLSEDTEPLKGRS